MSEIADFLRARYAERRALTENAIQAAGSGDWRYDSNNDHVSWVEFSEYASPVNRWTWWPLVTEAQSHVGDTIDDGLGAFIAAVDPNDVIADLDAKLAIVDELDAADPNGGYITATFTAHDALKILAQPFAGHPEHKGEEWAP